MEEPTWEFMLVAYNIIIYQKCYQTVKITIQIYRHYWNNNKRNNENAEAENRNARDCMQEDNSGKLSSMETCINLPETKRSYYLH